jgi:hypothetical protein
MLKLIPQNKWYYYVQPTYTSVLTRIKSLCFIHVWFLSRDRSVGIALSYRLDDRGSRVQFPAGTGNFSLHHIQNGSGAHPASYPTGTRAPCLGVKRPGREADHSPPSSAEVKEWVGLHLHSPNTPSWRGAQLKHRDNFTFTLYLFHVWFHFATYVRNSRHRHSIETGD